MLPLIVYASGSIVVSIGCLLSLEATKRIHENFEQEQARIANPKQPPKVIRKAVQALQKTSNNLQTINNQRQQQTDTIEVQAKALHQRVNQLKATNSALNNSTQQINDQSNILQNHLDELARLRNTLAETNQALQTSQAELATKQIELNALVTQLQTTQTNFSHHAIQNQAARDALLTNVINTHQTIENTIGLIIQNKDIQIRQLEQDILAYRRTLREINQFIEEIRPPGSTHVTALGLFSHSPAATLPTDTTEPTLRVVQA